MTKPAAVLWDMDGTLIDSEHYWLSSEQELAASVGASWTAEDGMSLIGMSLYDSSNLIKDKLGLEISSEEVIETLTNSVVAKLAKQLPWRPGARELLLELKQSGIPTALVTMSMRTNVDAVISKFGFDGFDVTVAGNEVSKGKPHPEPYLKAAELLGVPIEQCVAFEDSLTGLTSAEASGAIAIGIPNIVELPQKDGRIIWPTLSEVGVADLVAIYEERHND